MSRLAFAVAAHLEPEILIVDEVLAVGDASFQKKCLGKMGDVAKEGRTVLFVSHNMAAVQNLCTIGIVLSAGEVVFRGTALGRVGTSICRRSTTRDFGLVDLSHASRMAPSDSPADDSVHRALVQRRRVALHGNSVKPGDDLVFEIQYDTEEPCPRQRGARHLFVDRRADLFTVGARFSSRLHVQAARQGHADVPRPAHGAGRRASTG